MFLCNTVVTYGIEHRSTSTNIAANERLREIIAAADSQGAAFLAEIIAPTRAVRDGEYVKQGYGMKSAAARFSIDRRAAPARPPGQDGDTHGQRVRQFMRAIRA
jgi:hypothetical protein